MREFTTEELAAFHDNLADVLAKDGEGAAQVYLGQHLQRLPEEIRNEVIARMFFSEIVNEAQETEAIANAQEEGLEAIKALEALKEELLKREKAEK